MAAIKFVLACGPLLFSFGFLAPLIAQIMSRFGVDAPFGLSNLSFALIIAVLLGCIAQFRGRWLW